MKRKSDFSTFLQYFQKTQVSIESREEHYGVKKLGNEPFIKKISYKMQDAMKRIREPSRLMHEWIKKAFK